MVKVRTEQPVSKMAVLICTLGSKIVAIDPHWMPKVYSVPVSLLCASKS